MVTTAFIMIYYHYRYTSNTVTNILNTKVTAQGWSNDFVMRGSQEDVADF